MRLDSLNHSASIHLFHCGVCLFFSLGPLIDSGTAPLLEESLHSVLFRVNFCIFITGILKEFLFPLSFRSHKTFFFLLQ